MKLECKVISKVSQKGNEYLCLEISIGSYKKVVFLEQAEVELIKLLANTNK